MEAHGEGVVGVEVGVGVGGLVWGWGVVGREEFGVEVGVLLGTVGGGMGTTACHFIH